MLIAFAIRVALSFSTPDPPTAHTGHCSRTGYPTGSVIRDRVRCSCEPQELGCTAGVGVGCAVTLNILMNEILFLTDDYTVQRNAHSFFVLAS